MKIRLVRCPSCGKEAEEQMVGNFKVIACTCVKPSDLKLIDSNGEKLGRS